MKWKKRGSDYMEGIHESVEFGPDLKIDTSTLAYKQPASPWITKTFHRLWRVLPNRFNALCPALLNSQSKIVKITNGV